MDSFSNKIEFEILRTRGGLGSGLEIILPDNVWVNVPVYENFVKESPYMLVKEGDDFYIVRDGENPVRVKLPPNPEFYSKKTSDGIDMKMIGIVQGGYLAFYLGPKCKYWSMGLNCRFCSSGINIGRAEIENKSVRQVLEVAEAAFDEGIADYIHINTGFIPDESRGLKLLEPYVKLLKKELGCLVAVQTNPPEKNYWIEKAYSFGIDSMSFNFEVYNERVFKKICPGKAKLVGRERFFSAMEYAVDVFPSGSVAGEIIAGLEPVESTLEAINYITSIKALPIVCVFRPLEGTVLEKQRPPKPEELIPVFANVYKLCRKNKIRMSFADKVPLVITPLEGRYFTDDEFNFLEYIVHNFYRTKIGKRIFSKISNIRRRIKYGQV